MSTTVPPESSFEPGRSEERQRSSDILPFIYEELRKLAAMKMLSEPAGQTLNATALVHEAYLRLSKSPEEPRWDSPGHFYIAAADAMRHILIDRARRKGCVRHGGDLQRTELDVIAAPAPVADKAQILLKLDEALQDLSTLDERKGRLVKLRYFVGLNSQEAAEVLGISKATADRDWAYAKAWLHSKVQLSDD